MQPGDIALISVIALLLSVGYNVVQAMRMRRLRADADAVADLSAHLESVRREMIGVRTDLANERQAVEALTEELAEVGQTRGTFFDNMGYYVRTPLNLIIGYSELLLSGAYGDLGDVPRERITVIGRSGSDLLTYITDMIELHRLNYGGIELQFKPVDVLPLVESVIAEVKQQSTKDVTLQQQVESGIGPLLGDPARVAQVLRQLLTNALRFTKRGSVMIDAHLVRVQNGVASQMELPTIGWLSDGDWIVLSVHDTGIGIRTEDQASIFDTFYRAHLDQTNDERGLGLGLAIVKRLVELHHGAIWVKSAEKQGSTFFVALRAYRDARSKDAPGTIATESASNRA
ncbi:MAG: HAMP domain-containing histidine kinase [Anaerolineae bacterium]|nr:HAMP domain-containing histidine kinase [Anaerolineae bacterium]